MTRTHNQNDCAAWIQFTVRIVLTVFVGEMSLFVDEIEGTYNQRLTTNLVDKDNVLDRTKKFKMNINKLNLN